jgi:rubrerythrin
MTVFQKRELNEVIRDLCEYRMRLTGYAKQAHMESKRNIARLFEALSFSKQVQSLCLLNHLGCIGNTYENLSALTGNLEISSFDGAAGVDLSTNDILGRFDTIEERNKHLLKSAKDSTEAAKDLNIGNINVCSKCGYVIAGDAPGTCPVCEAQSGHFRVFLV